MRFRFPFAMAVVIAAALLGGSGFSQTPGRVRSPYDWTQAPKSTQDNVPKSAEVNVPKPVQPTTQPSTATAPSGPVTQGAAPDMVIGAGDLLEISVYGAPDFDKKEVRVSGNGDITLPMIGAQHVEGLNVDQAQALIASKLAEGQYFNNPQVTVFVKEYATQGVSVLGEVQKPGVYPLLGQRRLFDAISQAGGLTAKAGKAVTIARRQDPEHPIAVMLGNDLQASTEGNIDVHPGDTIVVSKAGIVYVVGDVKMPGGFVMENGRMTVLQALAMAQGANNTASLNSARLIHRKPDGAQQDTQIALKKILSSQATDIAMQPEDILFVPASAGKSAMRRSLDAIVQTATGVAIYRP